jgi:hypothetical protein
LDGTTNAIVRQPEKTLKRSLSELTHSNFSLIRSGRLLGRPGLVLTLLAVVAASCGDRQLRGTTSASPDGKTYLAVIDDNGGACGPILVDGAVWPHPIGEPGPIDPGVHKIACGGEIEFTIPAKTVFRFDYWGP